MYMKEISYQFVILFTENSIKWNIRGKVERNPKSLKIHIQNDTCTDFPIIFKVFNDVFTYMYYFVHRSTVNYVNLWSLVMTILVYRHLWLRLWGNRNSYDRIYSKAKGEGLVYPVPTINPPHYHTRMKKQRRFRTTIKLHDFIVANPVQNNQTINSKCFKINFTSTAASNEIVSYRDICSVMQ
jgi:hypothetical protein